MRCNLFDFFGAGVLSRGGEAVKLDGVDNLTRRSALRGDTIFSMRLRLLRIFDVDALPEKESLAESESAGGASSPFRR